VILKSKLKSCSTDIISSIQNRKC